MPVADIAGLTYCSRYGGQGCTGKRCIIGFFLLNTDIIGQRAGNLLGRWGAIQADGKEDYDNG